MFGMTLALLQCLVAQRVMLLLTKDAGSLQSMTKTFIRTVMFQLKQCRNRKRTLRAWARLARLFFMPF
jgi:hypothetical protein